MDMICEMYYLTAYFLIYSFLGWCLEVAYHAVCQGKIVNRGFLNGPFCPIYGLGMIMVLVILYPFTGNPLLLFSGGLILATLTELVGGFLLNRLFHMRWWDYSKEPFNLYGYICLKFSIAWGLAILFAVRLIHPLVELNVSFFDCPAGIAIIFIICTGFLIDLIATVTTVLHLNRDLKRLNELSQNMRNLSDDLTEKIGRKAIEAEVRVQEGRVKASLAGKEARDNLERFRRESLEAREKFLEKRFGSGRAVGKYCGPGRLLKAFPDLRSDFFQKELETIRKSLTQHKL